ncbi:MAG: UDP-N-acetylmuramoyl-tripeptide--D-alanyl-D-alanine ligase [Desulfoferrobacter sp.]
MRYRLKDIPLLMSTPVGRRDLLLGQRHNLWPLLRRLAGLYRRILLRKTKIAAVIGSYGKSTTTRALSAALHKKTADTSNSNSWSGLALTLLSIRPWEEHRALEVGISSGGWMKIYSQMIKPDIVVVTSIGIEHHRSLGTLENTRSEKAEMLRSLSSAGVAILNGDDPNVSWMAGQTSARVVTFGFGSHNDVTASEYSLAWPDGNRFTVHTEAGSGVVSSRLFGRHMVYPILAGVATGLVEGFDLNTILPAVEGLKPTQGRLQKIQLHNGAIVLRDDFKASLETIESALSTLSEIPAKRRIVCLGEVEDSPGSRGPVYRSLGEQLAGAASKAVFICSRKSFRDYRVGAMLSGMPQEDLIYAGNNWSTVHAQLQKDLSPGDAVLLKGRGSQRLERIALALEGKSVHCALISCSIGYGTCSLCPMLERGWKRQKNTI